MNDSITIKQVVELLRADGTLKGYFGPDECMEQTFTHLSYSSADVQPNTFFICKGLSFKEEYLLDAAAKGAGAYLSEQQYETALPCVLVSDIRRAMSLVSIAFYHKAYESFRLIGLTGTKGKTTTTYMIREMLERSGIKTGLIGTIEIIDGNQKIHANNTTPESMILHKYSVSSKKLSSRITRSILSFAVHPPYFTIRILLYTVKRVSVARYPL